MPATIAMVAEKYISLKKKYYVLSDIITYLKIWLTVYLRLLKNELMAKQNTIAATQYNSRKTNKIDPSVYMIAEHLLKNGSFINRTIQNTESNIGISPCMTQPSQSIHDFIPTIFMSSYKKIKLKN